MKIWTTVGVVLLLVLTGCSGSAPAPEGGEEANATATATNELTETQTRTESPITTDTATATDTETATATATPIETEEEVSEKKGVETDPLTITIQADESGSVSGDKSLTLVVSGNTSVESFDQSGEGDPFFSVSFNGEQVLESEEVTLDSEGKFSMKVPASEIRRFDGKDVEVNVTLWDDDLTSDDYVQSATTTISIDESMSTATPRPTPTDTPTSTDTPTATPTPTPTATPTPTPTATPEPEPEQEEADLPPLPSDGDYDCSHFDTHAQAQKAYEQESGDPHRLDRDDDGKACESLLD